MPTADLVTAVASCRLLEVRADAAIIRRGDASQGLYVVVEGRVRVEPTGRCATASTIELGPTDIFGESCLLAGGQRSADVIAQCPTTVLHMPTHALTRLIEKHPRIQSVLLSQLSKRLLQNLLSTSPLFQAFEASTLIELSKMFKVRRARRRAVVHDALATDRGLCIPLAGSLEIVPAQPDAEHAPRFIGPGDVIGQECLFGADPGRFEARASSDTVYLHLPGHRLSELAMSYPPFLEAISASMAGSRTVARAHG